MRTILLAGTLLAATGVEAAGDPESRARDVVADLSSRAFDRVVKNFDTTMSEALPADKLAAAWDGVVQQAGAFKAIREVKMEKKDAYDVAIIRGQFEKADLLIILSFDASQKIAGLFFKPAPPSAKWSPPPYAGEFEEREVTLDPKQLPGVLTLPKGAGPFRAVILVHGSGPNDRDESMGPNKMFKDLAYGFASKGIATLRYDKRTLKAPGEFDPSKGYTMKEEVLEDVRSAVTLLLATKEIDPKHIIVLGHSLGGALAPRIAAEDPRVARIISMAGTTRQMDVLVREQIKITAPGNAEVAANVEAFSKKFNDPKLGPTDVVDFLGAKLPGTYLIDLKKYDAAKTVAALKIPVFIAQGERDYQVTMVDFEAWRTALKGKKTATLKSYPALNHHFLEGKGPSTPSEYMTPGHVPLEVITDLSAWIAK